MTGYPNNQGNPAGAIPQYAVPSPVNTYRVQIAAATPAASVTDMVMIQGSATKTIAINRIQVTADAPAVGEAAIYVYRRAALDTGGTSTAPAICKLNSANPVPTAVVKLYSANPTINDTGVLVTADVFALPNAATTGYPGVPFIEDFGNRGDQALIINGAAECVCIGGNGSAIPTGIYAFIMVEWTEY